MIIVIDVDIGIYFSFKEKIGASGKTSLEIDDDSTVLDLLSDMTERFPKLEGRIFEEPGEVKRYIQIRLNQRSIDQLEGLETKLKEGDELLILPKLGGG